MKGIQIFTSLSSVSNEYIEALAPNHIPQKRHVGVVKRVVLVAACLVLLICTVFTLSHFVNRPEGPIGGYSTDIGNLESLNNNSEQDSTTSFSVDDINDSSDISEPVIESSDIENSDISGNTLNDESIEIPPINNNDNGDFTATEIAAFFPKRMDASTNAYQVLTFESLDNIMLGLLPNGEQLSAFESQNVNFDYYEMEMGGTLKDSIYIDGKTIYLNKNCTYQEVYNSVLEILPYLQRKFGIEYSDIIVNKRTSTDEYDVYIYDDEIKKDFYVDGRPMLFGESHISLSIGSRVNPDEYISLNALFYYGSSSKMKEIGSYKTISLEEVEALLNQGYVFGGHSCKWCMENQSDVDFSNYDKVGIEYVENPENKLVYPFYAFYKSIGDERYARTYVSAFNVCGLEEYFELQANNH